MVTISETIKSKILSLAKGKKNYKYSSRIISEKTGLGENKVWRIINGVVAIDLDTVERFERARLINLDKELEK